MVLRLLARSGEVLGPVHNLPQRVPLSQLVQSAFVLAMKNCVVYACPELALNVV